MLTNAEQQRRAVLMVSLENALGIAQVHELHELVELERKDAASRQLPVDRFDCLKCGPSVSVDEDACCFQCGQSAVEIDDNKPLYGEPNGCNVCGTHAEEDGVRAVGKYRACLGCEPEDFADEPTTERIPDPRTCGVAKARTSTEPDWCRELNRLINESLFLSDKDSYAELEHYKTMNDRGVTRWGTNLFWKVDQISDEMFELWTLEILCRNVLAKSPIIVLPEEVAVLMPGDYVVPHGTWRYAPTKQSADLWLYRGDCGDVASIEESTERILAAIDKRGAEILSRGAMNS